MYQDTISHLDKQGWPIRLFDMILTSCFNRSHKLSFCAWNILSSKSLGGKVQNVDFISLFNDCPGDKNAPSQHKGSWTQGSNLESHLWLTSFTSQSKNLQNKHLITVGTGFGNTRAPKTHHTMRNSRRLARYKAHGFFLATRRHWDALTKHAGSITPKMEWNGLRKTKLFSCWGIASTMTLIL